MKHKYRDCRRKKRRRCTAHYLKDTLKTGGVMTEQENILHSTWRIIWLEQEKENLYREYIDKIAAINLEIEQLRSKTSNATLVTNQAQLEIYKGAV